MSRDPFDIPQPRQLQKREPHFSDEFWQQAPDMRPTTKRERMATLNVCRFDPQNKSVLHIRGGCPHFPEEK